MFASGVFLYVSFMNYKNLSRPVVAMTDLDRYAGTKELIRIQGTAMVDSPVATPAGEPLAFEYIVVTHESPAVGNSTSTTTEKDYESFEPAKFWASDGTNKVQILTKNITYDNLNVRGATELKNGKVEGTLAPLIPISFWTDFKPNGWHDQRLKVSTISRGDHLDIVGQVTRQPDGKLAMEWLPFHGLWVSTHPPEEMQKQSINGMRLSAAGAAAGLITSLAGLWLLLKQRKNHKDSGNITSP